MITQQEQTTAESRPWEHLVPPIMGGRDLPGWVERTVLAAVGERDAVDRIAG